MMRLSHILNALKPKAPPSDGAFSFSNVDIEDPLPATKWQRKPKGKRFSHAPHIRAEIPALKAKAKQRHIDNVELLEAHFLWELNTFRRVDIHKHRLMWRFLRRFDPGLHEFLTTIAQEGKWYEIMERCREEYDHRQAFDYKWPERCEPFYHRCMPDALVGMRALGRAMLDAKVKTSFDPAPSPTADADKGGDQGGSGGMSKAPKKTVEEEDLPTVVYVPVEQIEALEGPKPPWVR